MHWIKLPIFRLLILFEVRISIQKLLPQCAYPRKYKHFWVFPLECMGIVFWNSSMKEWSHSASGWASGGGILWENALGKQNRKCNQMSLLVPRKQTQMYFLLNGLLFCLPCWMDGKQPLEEQNVWFCLLLCIRYISVRSWEHPNLGIYAIASYTYQDDFA